MLLSSVTLFVDVTKVCESANLQSASLQVCKSASLQVCKSASLQVSHTARYIKIIKRKWGEKWLCTREISSSSAIRKLGNKTTSGEEVLAFFDFLLAAVIWREC